MMWKAPENICILMKELIWNALRWISQDFNIGWVNGLVPDNTKPLVEPMMTKKS